MDHTQPEAAKPDPDGERRKSAESLQFGITMDCTGDYEFRIRFDKESYGVLTMDEPPPMGTDRGPNASRILAAAIGNCLSASLLFCARKARINIRSVHTEARVNHTRNEQGRLRIGKIKVEVYPRFDFVDLPKAQRCLELFEDYCVVTQTVRQGMNISVRVNLPQP